MSRFVGLLLLLLLVMPCAAYASETTPTPVYLTEPATIVATEAVPVTGTVSVVSTAPLEVRGVVTLDTTSTASLSAVTITGIGEPLLSTLRRTAAAVAFVAGLVVGFLYVEVRAR